MFWQNSENVFKKKYSQRNLLFVIRVGETGAIYAKAGFFRLLTPNTSQRPCWLIMIVCCVHLIFLLFLKNNVRYARLSCTVFVLLLLMRDSSQHFFFLNVNRSFVVLFVDANLCLCRMYLLEGVVLLNVSQHLMKPSCLLPILSSVYTNPTSSWSAYALLLSVLTYCMRRTDV